MIVAVAPSWSPYDHVKGRTGLRSWDGMAHRAAAEVVDILEPPPDDQLE